MRYFVILFCLFIAAIEIAFPVGAVTTPPIDEVEAMLKKVESNLRQASAVVSVAKAKGEKMVEGKVQEKAELKEAVIVAEKKAEAVVEQMHVIEDKMEVYAVKMVGAGLDTTTQPVQFKGVVYDAYLNYVSEGGKEDFEYFRVYLWQPK
jgi:hypothetical protein